MNLKSRGIALSFIPLIFLLLLTIPEAISQFEAHAAIQQANRSQRVGAAAREIEDAVLDVGMAARATLGGGARAQLVFASTLERLRSARANFDVVAASNAQPPAAIAHVAEEVAAYRAFSETVARDARRGRSDRAIATMMSEPYNRTSRTLRRTLRAFGARTRVDEVTTLASLDRLRFSSVCLLAILLVGMTVVCLVVVRLSSRYVNGIVAVGRKADRYRRGEPLGPPLGATDEIGRLDAALHQLIAERDARERQLERYRLLADVTQDVIVFIDHDDLEIVDANAATLSTYGYALADLIGQPSSMLRAAESPRGSDGGAPADRPDPPLYEETHRRSDGTEFPVEVVTGTSVIGGRSTIVATIRDISARRRAAEDISAALDQALEGSRLKSEFVATMSHEIRTPMHGVIGMSELLLETQLNTVQREYARTLKESAQALLGVIDDVLDFSKLESNKLELEAVTFDPASVVAGAVNLARGTSREKRLALRSYASPHVPDAVRGDPTRLRQVLINLIGNAVKFTLAGSVTVSMSVERDDGQVVVLSFAVSDTGIGVAPEARERLFEAFVQGDGSTTRRFGGTGLGLSISRRLVDLMGGRIWLAEHEGAGATFCFTARFERTTDTVALPVPVAGAIRVLILDDDAATRRVLGVMLASLRIESVACDDTESARRLLRDAKRDGTPFDVILIDYVLPQSDGFAFAIEIGNAPELGAPARIMITAFDAAGLKRAAIAAGCAACLAKPIDPSELYDAVSGIERTRRSGGGAIDGAVKQARILLVEDSPLVRRVTRFQLQELDFGVDVVENGKEAVTATTAADYELVLMDMRMPEMDGLSATRAIRATERTSGRHVIVVALTANALDGDREACMDAGMDDFLTKPLQLDALRDILTRWLPAHV